MENKFIGPELYGASASLVISTNYLRVVTHCEVGTSPPSQYKNKLQILEEIIYSFSIAPNIYFWFSIC